MLTGCATGRRGCCLCMVRGGRPGGPGRPGLASCRPGTPAQTGTAGYPNAGVFTERNGGGPDCKRFSRYFQMLPDRGVRALLFLLFFV